MNKAAFRSGPARRMAPSPRRSGTGAHHFFHGKGHPAELNVAKVTASLTSLSRGISPPPDEGASRTMAILRASPRERGLAHRDIRNYAIR